MTPLMTRSSAGVETVSEAEPIFWIFEAWCEQKVKEQLNWFWRPQTGKLFTAFFICLSCFVEQRKLFYKIISYYTHYILSAIVQARRLSLFGHIARTPDETDARSIITASPSRDWRKPPGRPRTMWMKTIQQDLKSNNLSLDEAITVAQNRPLWRLMSAFGAMHP